MGIVFKNNATSTLAAPLAWDATSLTVQVGDAAKFPTLDSGEWFPLTLSAGFGLMEIVKVTARAGAVMRALVTPGVMQRLEFVGPSRPGSGRAFVSTRATSRRLVQLV